MVTDVIEKRYLEKGKAIAYLLQQRDLMLDKMNNAENATDCKKFSSEADACHHKAMTLVLTPTNWA